MNERTRFEREMELLAVIDSMPSEGENGKGVNPCQQRWLDEVKKFPEEVRTALLNIQTYGWQHPVAWAIKKGIRDAKRLNRIAFYGEKGMDYGYCEPSSPAAKTAWAKTTKAVAAFLKKPWPPVFQSGPAPCGKRKIVTAPDKPSVDITGRYYTQKPARTYVMNQAGVHIEGFASPVRMRTDKTPEVQEDHRPVTSFEGEVRGDKIYWFNRDQPENFGEIARKGTQLYLGGQLLKPMEKRPTLFMGMDPDTKFDLPARHEITPLTPDQLATIRNLLNPYHLNQIFAAFHNNANHDAIATLHRRWINDPPCWMQDPVRKQPWCEPRFEQFYQWDLPLVRAYVQLVLTAQTWTNNRNTTLSHIQWIQRMLDLKWGKAPDSAVYELWKFTGLKPNKIAGTGEHKYEFDFTITGLSVILAGYSGTLTVSKTSGRKWSKKYFVDFWGGNISLTLVDLKIGNSFKGVAQSDIEWTENDIPGSVRLARASASVAMDVASAQAGFLHLYGNGSLPMLPVFFQDASLGLPNMFKILEEKGKSKIDTDPSAKFTAKGVFGLDAGVSVLGGEISNYGDFLKKITHQKTGYDPVDLSLTPKWDVSTSHNLQAEVHFCFDTDTPTEAARQAIRIMTARELPQLMSPASTLAVVGHADTIGKAEYNKGLSERRASKTVDAIKEILGSKFKIPEANIKKYGKGEEMANLESKGKTQAAPKHRRVQIFLNAKLVLTLYSGGKP